MSTQSQPGAWKGMQLGEWTSSGLRVFQLILQYFLYDCCGEFGKYEKKRSKWNHLYPSIEGAIFMQALL